MLSRFIRAKRTTQSNQDNNSGSGKLQLSGGLFSSTVTECDKKGEEKSESKPLFNFTTQGTAGSTSLFGGPATSNNTLLNFSFKPAAPTQAATGGSSVFSSGSLFGGPGPQPTGGLFGNSTGGGLFGTGNQVGGLFGNRPTLFNNPSGGSLFSVEGSAPKK